MQIDQHIDDLINKSNYRCSADSRIITLADLYVRFYGDRVISSHHIISYHIISYHIISYHIILAIFLRAEELNTYSLSSKRQTGTVLLVFTITIRAQFLSH